MGVRSNSWHQGGARSLLEQRRWNPPSLSRCLLHSLLPSHKLLFSSSCFWKSFLNLGFSILYFFLQSALSHLLFLLPCALDSQNSFWTRWCFLLQHLWLKGDKISKSWNWLNAQPSANRWVHPQPAERALLQATLNIIVSHKFWGVFIPYWHFFALLEVFVRDWLSLMQSALSFSFLTIHFFLFFPREGLQCLYHSHAAALDFENQHLKFQCKDFFSFASGAGLQK